MFVASGRESLLIRKIGGKIIRSATERFWVMTPCINLCCLTIAFNFKTDKVNYCSQSFSDQFCLWCHRKLHIKHSSLLYNFFSLTGVCSNNHNSFLYFIFGPCFRLVSLIIFLNVIFYINMHFCIDCHQVPKKAALCMNIPFRITLSRDNKC